MVTRVKKEVTQFSFELIVTNSLSNLCWQVTALSRNVNENQVEQGIDFSWKEQGEILTIYTSLRVF